MDIFYYCRRMYYYDDVKKLIDKGANVNATDKDGKTPLMIASENGRKYICKLLIEKNAIINAKTKIKSEYDGKYYNTGPTALMYASQYNHKKICELLIEKGANIDLHIDGSKTGIKDAQYHHKWTALMYASKMGNKRICELLIEKGAEMNQALIRASKMGRKDIC